MPLSEGDYTVEHASERQRWRHPREGDDRPGELRKAEGGVEVQEHEAGNREDSETRGSVERRLGAAMRELEAREGKEATISWKLRKAFDDLERREQRKESTEAKLREALESLKDDEDSVQLTLEAAVQLGGTEAARDKNDTREGSDVSGRHQIEVSEVDTVQKRIDVEKESSRQFGYISTKNEFDEALACYPELELRSRFESRYEEVVRYYVASESGIETCKPELVIELENREVRRMYEEANGGPPNVRIESMKDVDELIEKHSDNISVSEKLYENAETYFRIRNESGKNQHQLAAEYGLSQSKISDIRRGVETKLIKTLRMREEECTVHDWADTQSRAQTEKNSTGQSEIKEQRFSVERSAVQKIEPESIKDSFTQIRESNRIDRKSIEDAIERMVQISQNTESRVKMADLRQSGIDSVRMTAVRLIINLNTMEIEKHLKERLSVDEVRIGLISDRLYVWTPNMSPNDMLNAWRTQYFYLNNHDMAKMVDTVGTHMDLGDSRREKLRNLNELMHQMVRVETLSDAIKIDGDRSRMPGEAMHLQRDMQGIRNKDLEGIVKKVSGINGHGGINNPKFPEGHRLEALRARLIATSLSDCHIRIDASVVEYYEQNLQRLERLVNQVLREFGDFTNEPEYVEKDNVYKLRIQSPYGRALNEWGVPSGDKAILNPCLPNEVTKWLATSIIAYHEDMIAQEGHVSPGQVSWNRSNTLHSGVKSEKYDSVNRISEGETRLIQSKGNDYAGSPNGAKTLLWTTIENLRKSTESEETEAARALHDTILENRNKLMDDEKNIAEKLGIDLSIRPVQVTYYPESGRVSVKWVTRTSNPEAVIRWGLVCPPNHPKKREELKKWIIAQNPEKVRRIAREVEEDGLPIHSIWRD